MARKSWVVAAGAIRTTGHGTLGRCGLVADPSALHGLLTNVRDLGHCLISARRLDTGQAGNETP